MVFTKRTCEHTFDVVPASLPLYNQFLFNPPSLRLRRCCKPSVMQTNHLDGNPYSAPQESSTVSSTPQLNSSRVTASVLTVLVGVPVAGVLAYLLFGYCYGIGSRVISDTTYDQYASSMFRYGATAAVLPSLLCGLLNSRRPIAVLLLSHFVGVVLGAVIVSSGFRWYYAMGTYFLVTLLLPVVASTARRLT